jgi:uncharacterized protein
MSKENEKTLKVYDEYGFDYVKTTFVHEKKNPEKAAKKQAKTEAFLKESFSALAARDKILEIGSGGGENAEYLTKLEYRVTASDVSEQFQEVLREKGLKCRKLNILTDEIDELFDGALAWRVFVHFTPEDLEVAAKKIFKALRPGGRFVCNIINRAAHDVDCEWQDFDNDYHLGVDRFFQYYNFDQAEKILTGAGFDIAKFFYDGENDKWMIFVLEKPTGVRKEVEDYIKNVVLPKYEKLPGHTITHINQVISHSFMIAEKLPELNRDMIYVTAAYHDLGRLVNDDNHHIESGKMLREDKELGKLFSEEEIEIMAEAVEDHRASLKGDPRSVYGKIVSSADRDMDINDMLERSYDYTTHLHPEMTDDERIEDARIHLREKFAPDGYGAKKVYFPTPDEIECFKKVEEMTRDPATFRQIMKDYNKKRGINV